MAQINILKARQVTSLSEGFYKDGGCLFLRVSGPTARQWVFRYKRRNKVTQLGLGSVVDRDLEQIPFKLHHSRHGGSTRGLRLG